MLFFLDKDGDDASAWSQWNSGRASEQFLLWRVLWCGRSVRHCLRHHRKRASLWIQQ